MGLTGGRVRVCAPVPHRWLRLPGTAVFPCQLLGGQQPAAAAELPGHGQDAAGEELLFASEKYSKYSPGTRSGAAHDDLSLGSGWGGPSRGLSVEKGPGWAGREPRELSGPNLYPNPSRALGVAEPRRSPGLREAGLGLGFPARKPVAGWLLAAPTVTQGQRVAALAAPGRIHQSAPLGLSPPRLPLEVPLLIPQLPKGEQTARAAPEQAFPAGRHFQRSLSHCKFTPGSQVPCREGGCSEHRRTLTFPCSCALAPGSHQQEDGTSLSSIPTPGSPALPGELRVRVSPCRLRAGAAPSPPATSAGGSVGQRCCRGTPRGVKPTEGSEPQAPARPQTPAPASPRAQRGRERCGGSAPTPPPRGLPASTERPRPAGRCPGRPRRGAGARGALCKSGIGAAANGSRAARGASQWGAAAAGRAAISAARRRRRGQCGGGRRAGRSGAAAGGSGARTVSARRCRAAERPLPAGHVGPRQVRRQGAGQGQVALVAGRAAVPGGPRAPAAAQGELRGAGGRRGAGVPGGRAGVPLGRDPGAGGQRGPRQQEDAHHPAAPAAGHPQRRGAQQAAGRRDHRAGRRPAQHPGRAAAQEDAELQEVSAGRPSPAPGPPLPRCCPPCCPRGDGGPLSAPPAYLGGRPWLQPASPPLAPHPGLWRGAGERG